MGETEILPFDDNSNADLLLAQYARLDEPGILLSLSFYVTHAAGNLRLGIYDDSGPDGGPGQKLVETNSFATVDGWNTADADIHVMLPAGNYWLAYLPDDNNLGFLKADTPDSRGVFYSYSFGPLPANFSASPSMTPSHWSFYATLTTMPDIDPPVISQVNITSITQNSALIHWKTNEGSDSQVEYGHTPAYGDSTMLDPALVTVHQQMLSGLAPSTFYHFRVKSNDLAGNRATSMDFLFMTTPPDLEPPGTPADLLVTGVASTRIQLGWTASTDNVGVTGYYIERCTGSGCLDFDSIDVSISNDYVDKGLNNNTTYRYRVRAIDAAGNESAYSDTVEATTLNPPSVHVDSTGRYLLDQYDEPFMIVGDAPQSLIVNLSPEEAEYYLADRQTHGFNSVWINLLCNSYTAGRPDGTTYDGLAPFDTPGDLATPDESYFERVDEYLHLAGDHDLIVFLDPIETGGWLGTLHSNGLSKAFDYGVYLGMRYRDYPNIIWMSGNDFQSWGNPDDDALVQAVAMGILSVDTNHLHTAEMSYLSSTTLDDPTWEPIASLNAAYTYYPTYDEVLHAYNHSPSVPVFMVEEHYELENVGGEMGTPLVLRRQEYWTMTSGATGQLYGNAYTWQFLDNWKENIDTRGVAELQIMKNFFDTLPWYDLVPDQTQHLITDGFGTYSTSGNVSESDYATAAATPDGKRVVAYLPTPRTVSIDLGNLAGQVKAYWFDPTSGTYSDAPGSPFSNHGMVPFTSPGLNAAGEEDWVLVLMATDTTTSLVGKEMNVPSGELKIYPNPIHGSGIFYVDPWVSGGEIRIYDITGKERWRQIMEGHILKIDEGVLEPGIYFVSLKDGQHQWMSKVVME